MLRFSLITLTVCALDFPEDPLSPDVNGEKLAQIEILNEEVIDDLFSRYQKRFTVSLTEEDFATATLNHGGPEYTGLLDCSHYFFDKFQQAGDRFALLLLNSTQLEMRRDAAEYLNCNQLPCYSIEIESNDDGAKAYTLSMKDFGYEKASGHDFSSSCKKFVDLYLDESEKGTIKYFRNNDDNLHDAPLHYAQDARPEEDEDTIVDSI
eukprot:GEMP01052753.1.p1 GENE.GEMP01052753.1~~GEMP01052753.1.p1  ORF type:complete len:208 (+),score=33.19 GEMP01052753.1:27-650(+)